MIKEIGRTDLIGYEKRLKNHKKHVITIAVFVILAVVIVCIYLVNSYLNRTFNSYKVVDEIERADSNTVKYASYGDKIIKYSRDGASAISDDGSVVWNGSYELQNPTIDMCGDYVAIADVGGTELYVYNGSDSGTKVEVLLPIVEVEVANQGLIAVVMENTDSNLIQLIDPYSSAQVDNVVVEKQTSIQNNGFPVDISISNDGTKMVTNYLSVKNGVIQSQVTFYNFGEVGQNEVDRLVGMKDYGDQVIAKVEFLDNDTVGVYGESSVTLYSMKEINEEIKTLNWDKKINSIFSSSDYFGVILEDGNSEGNYQVCAYDLSGKEVMNENVDYQYTSVELSGSDLIFHSETTCNILRINGTEKFHYEFNKNLSYIFPLNNYTKYYLIDDTNINIIKLTEE